jgi:hypothetical protein
MFTYVATAATFSETDAEGREESVRQLVRAAAKKAVGRRTVIIGGGKAAALPPQKEISDCRVRHCCAASGGKDNHGSGAESREKDGGESHGQRSCSQGGNFHVWTGLQPWI